MTTPVVVRARGTASPAAARLTTNPPLQRIVLSLVLLVTVLRTVPGLADRPLSYDESFAVRLATRPVSELVEVTGSREPFLLLHDLLLRPWVALFGMSTSSVRLLSVLVTLGIVVMVHRIAQAVISPRTALLAAALAGNHGSLLLDARDAGSGALSTLMITTVVLLLIRMQRGDRTPRSTWTLAAVSCAAVWSAPFAAVAVLGAIGVVAGLDRTSRSVLTRVAPWIAVACAPLAWYVASGSAAYSGWYSAAADQQYLGPRAAAALVGGTSPWVTIVAGGLAGLLLLAWWRRQELDAWTATDVSAPLVLAWALGPLTIGLLISSVVPVLSPRALALSAPATCLGLAAAAGLAWARSWFAAATVCCVGVLASIGPRLIESSTPTEPDWRAAAATLVAEGSATQRVATDPAYLTIPLWHALQEAGTDSAAPQPIRSASWDDLGVDETPTVDAEPPPGSWTVSLDDPGRSTSGEPGSRVIRVGGLLLTQAPG